MPHVCRCIVNGWIQGSGNRSRTFARYDFVDKVVKKSNNDSIVKDCLCVNIIHNILHKIYITILSLINNEFGNGNITLAYRVSRFNNQYANAFTFTYN